MAYNQFMEYLYRVLQTNRRDEIERDGIRARVDRDGKTHPMHMWDNRAQAEKYHAMVEDVLGEAHDIWQITPDEKLRTSLSPDPWFEEVSDAKSAWGENHGAWRTSHDHIDANQLERLALRPTLAPVLHDPEIELGEQDQLENFLMLDEQDRQEKLLALEKELTELYNEPNRRGSDRWVFLTEHVVYKMPSPYSFGSGQSGAFASLSEAGSADPDLAQCRLVYSKDGVPIVIMERVEITHEEIDGPALGLNKAGQTVQFDGGRIN